ncbi:hypothetical protein GEMRC1_002731 [Eukaryota sp. GEM-RC1]
MDSSPEVPFKHFCSNPQWQPGLQPGRYDVFTNGTLEPCLKGLFRYSNLRSWLLGSSIFLYMVLARACVTIGIGDQYARMYDVEHGLAQLRDTLIECLDVLANILRVTRPQVSLIIAHVIRKISNEIPNFVCTTIEEKFEAEARIMTILDSIELDPLPKSDVTALTLSSRIEGVSVEEFSSDVAALSSLVASSPIVNEIADKSSPFLNIIDISKSNSFMIVGEHLPEFLKLVKFVREETASILKDKAIITPITSIMTNRPSKRLFSEAIDSYSLIVTDLRRLLGREEITVGCQSYLLDEELSDSSCLGLFTLDDSGDAMPIRTLIEEEFVNTHNALVGNYSLGSIDLFSINSDSFVQIKCEGRGITLDPFTCRLRIVDHVYDGYILSGLIKHKIEPIESPEFLLSKTKDLYDLEDILLEEGFTVDGNVVFPPSVIDDDYLPLYNEIIIVTRTIATEPPNDRSMSLKAFLKQRKLDDFCQNIGLLLKMNRLGRF